MNSARQCVVNVLSIMLIIVIVAGVITYILRVPLLVGLADYLVVDDPLTEADIIFVLGGDVDSRPFHAVELYNQEVAPEIVLARAEDGPAAELGYMPNISDVTVEIILAEGVITDDLTVLTIPGGATSTYDETLILRDYIIEHDIDRVVVVTTAFHTRRASWIFDRNLGDMPIELSFSAADEFKFDTTNWWQIERGLITLFNEYVKLGYYWLSY